MTNICPYYYYDSMYEIDNQVEQAATRQHGWLKVRYLTRLNERLHFVNEIRNTVEEATKQTIEWYG